MNKEQREECSFIRTLSSREAADWLLQRYDRLPFSMAHRSWNKADQIRLAERYLTGHLPFVSSHGYDAFLSIMSIGMFIEIIGKSLPKDPDKIRLLLYYVVPSLRKFQRTEKQAILVTKFIETLKRQSNT